MPVTLDQMTYDEMRSHERAEEKCAECGAALTVCSGVWHGFDSQFILACTADKTHVGLFREATPGIEPGTALPGSMTKRGYSQMVAEHGVERAKALAPFQSAALTEEKAKVVVATLWPKAPPVEKAKAAMVCHQFGLNPLMKHIFLVPFNEGKDNETWEMLLSIKATRLIAARHARYGYVDNTPRAMTEDEQREILGKVVTDRLVFLTRLKTLDGMTAHGVGYWPKDKGVKGADKGNTPENMAAIRSERQAFDRLIPGMMPDAGVIDADYVDVTEEGDTDEAMRVVDQETGEILEPDEVEDSIPGADPDEPFENEPEETEPDPPKAAAPDFSFEFPKGDADKAICDDGMEKVLAAMKHAEIRHSQAGAYMNGVRGWKLKNLRELTNSKGRELIQAINEGKV
jgi:hypothetical protein